ncbi:hypothetical protein ACWD60_37350, partial [Streptomyces sp. NPDC005167]
AQDNAAYSGRVTASAADGTVLARTAIGLNKEGQRVTLSVTAKDRRGANLPGTLVLKDIERNTAPKVYEIDASGRMDLRIPPSTYSAWMYAPMPGIDGTHTLGFGVFSAPQIDLDADRTVRFDASALRKAAAFTPQATANQFMRVDQYRANRDLFLFMDSYMPEYWRYDSLWATPTPKVTKGTYNFATRWRQVQPPLVFSSGSRDYDDVTIQSMSPKLPEGTGTYRAIWAGDGSAADFRKVKVRGQVAVVRRSDTVSAPDQAAAAATAGARQLLILNDGYGKFDPWAELPDAAPLPVASLGTDDAARLLSRLRKPGTATLKVVSHPYPRYLYDLVRSSGGAIPRDPSYRPRSGELARIDETFRNTRQGEAAQWREDVSAVTGSPMLINSTTVRAQGTLTSWVTAGSTNRWITAAAMRDLGERGMAHSYRAGSTNSENWFSPIQHPRLLNDGVGWRSPYRTGDIISASVVPAWGDSGGHAGVAWADGDTSKISFYQGDQLLGEDFNERIIAVEGLSPDPLPYRLVVEGYRNLPDRPYSTRTRTEWDFTSGTTDHTVLTTLPLVQLDYAVATDLTGKAQRRTSLTVTASHLKGAAGAGAIRTVTLDVSYDDGATWQKAKSGLPCAFSSCLPLAPRPRSSRGSTPRVGCPDVVRERPQRPSVSVSRSSMPPPAAEAGGSARCQGRPVGRTSGQLRQIDLLGAVSLCAGRRAVAGADHDTLVQSGPGVVAAGGHLLGLGPAVLAVERRGEDLPTPVGRAGVVPDRPHCAVGVPAEGGPLAHCLGGQGDLFEGSPGIPAVGRTARPQLEVGA